MANSIFIRTKDDAYQFNKDNISVIRKRVSIDKTYQITEIVLVDGLKYTFSSNKNDSNYLTNDQLNDIQL